MIAPDFKACRWSPGSSCNRARPCTHLPARRRWRSRSSTRAPVDRTGWQATPVPHAVMHEGGAAASAAVQVARLVLQALSWVVLVASSPRQVASLLVQASSEAPQLARPALHDASWSLQLSALAASDVDG